MSGYAAVGLVHPKFDTNVGGAMRACACYGASLVLYQGHKVHRVSTDVHNTYKKIPLLKVDSIVDSFPFDCVPVAVDLLPEAESLIEYEHPRRALYIFGPEDGTLGKSVWQKCRDIVYVPNVDGLCMNLAATVNVVLYDRMAKE